MKILVVGGADYIGSQMVLMLAEQGHDVVVLDDLSTGYRDAVLAGQFIQGNTRSTTSAGKGMAIAGSACQLPCSADATTRIIAF